MAIGPQICLSNNLSDTLGFECDDFSGHPSGVREADMTPGGCAIDHFLSIKHRVTQTKEGSPQKLVVSFHLVDVERSPQRSHAFSEIMLSFEVTTPFAIGI